MRSLILIIALVTQAIAAEGAAVGVWRFGLGSVDGQPAKVGTLVLTGQTVVSADATPLRLICSEAPGITVVLAAGSDGVFQIENDAAGGRILVLELNRGAVQVDVRDRSPYAGVRVRGAAADVTVTGTLFTVERVRRDADYVALVRGTVKVGMRPAVAKAAGRPEGEEIELRERQGVAADATGLGTPEPLSARPQVALPAGLRASIRDQGMGLSDQGTNWGTDLAGELTGALLEGAAPPALAGGGLPGPVLFVNIAEDLANSLTELGQPPPSSSGSTQVIAGAPAAPTPPAGMPPPPPPPPGP